MNDKNAFRQCLGRFATGVTVITCTDAAGTACGMTANSFSSVSLDPPLILWNIAKVSQFLDAYLEAAHFGVNVLSAQQTSVSIHFAQSKPDLFDGIDHTTTGRGVPRLNESLAWFECRTHQVHDCGDHFIIVGAVTEFAACEGQPLIFFAGDYAKLGTT